MVPCLQKAAEETHFVTEATPFYPQRRGGYYVEHRQEHDGGRGSSPVFYQDEHEHHAHEERHHYPQYQLRHPRSQPQPVELPETKSLADLGLDSLGFVSDTDEGDDSGQETTLPQTQQRQTQRQQLSRVTHRLYPEGEGEGERPLAHVAPGGDMSGNGASYHGHGHGQGEGYDEDEDEVERDDGFEGGGYYSQAHVQLHAASGYHPTLIPAQHQQYHAQHQHQYVEGRTYPGDWSHYQHHQYHQYHQQHAPQLHQHQHQHQQGGGDGYYGDGDEGPVDKYGYSWEYVSRTGMPGDYGVDPEEMGDLDEHEFLTFLQESFPGYSLESLEELLAAHNNDISLTVEMLTALDIEEKPPEPPPLDDESNFPTLGGGSRLGGGDNKGVEERGSQSATLTLGGTADAEVDNSPPSPPSEVFRNFTISGGRSNVRGAAGVLSSPTVGAKDESGSNFADRLKTQSSIPMPLTRDGARTTERGSVQIGYGAGNFGGQRSQAAASHQPWVETGEAVSNLYATTREDARDHMRLRNICFQQATQAYLTGNKALAKELSRKGRNHARDMRAAHDEAAGSIFRERNANINIQPNGNNLGAAPGGPKLLDLHGLHVAEAVAVLRRELPNCRAKGERVIHVLVGTGHHVKGSRTPARLPAAVAEFLSATRICFWEPQAGMLEVDVASVPG